MSRKSGELRKGEITAKDMSVLREGDNTYVQHKSGGGVLRDYGLQHQITLRWDLNPDAIRDHIFIMKIDDYEVILDSEEVMRLIRWV